MKLIRSKKLIRRQAILGVIAKGEQDIRSGRTLSPAQAKKRMAKWLK